VGLQPLFAIGEHGSSCKLRRVPSEKPSGRLGGLDASALMRMGAAASNETAPPDLPGYQLIASIGRGGMGEVFRAKQESLGRVVAVKILRGDLPTVRWLPERFENEARTMAALHHPNLVTVHDCVRLDDGCVAIVMELVEGGALRALIADGGLPMVQALAWARDIASGLGAAHAAGIVHRDVKPENVLIDSGGRARVTDFGMAFSAMPDSPRFTLTGAVAGTLGYMAPEQLRGGTVDVRTDIFSLGVLLYEMLTGRLPQGTFRSARELRPEVPVALDDFIHSALRPEPELRPANTNALLDALEARPKAFTRRRAVAAAVVAGAGGTAAWWLMRRNDHPSEGGKESVAASPETWRTLPWPADPNRTSISGGWKIENGALISDETIAIIPIMKELPEMWRVRLRFTRLTSIYSVGIFFRAPLGTAVATLAGRGRNIGGLQSVGGITLDDSGGFEMPLENGRRYDWIIELLGGRFRMWVDDVLKYERVVAGKVLSVPNTWMWNPQGQTPALLLGSWKSATRFESLEWRPI
jgi:serine/threonine protein kinase